MDDLSRARDAERRHCADASLSTRPAALTPRPCGLPTEGEVYWPRICDHYPCMTALLSLYRVAKRFETGLEAIRRLDLEVQPGEFVSLVGPSGCGKSTALRVIAGLLRPPRARSPFPAGGPRSASCSRSRR